MNNVIHKIKEDKKVSVVEFKTGNRLIIDTENNELKVLGENQSVQLIISLAEDKLTININAQKININAEEELNFNSKKINFEAKDKINIKTNGNLIQEIKKDNLIEIGGTNKMIAQVHKITASLGNVEVKANDDVKLNGERVKFNCD